MAEGSRQHYTLTPREHPCFPAGAMAWAGLRPSKDVPGQPRTGCPLLACFHPGSSHLGSSQATQQTEMETQTPELKWSSEGLCIAQLCHLAAPHPPLPRQACMQGQLCAEEMCLWRGRTPHSAGRAG